MRDTMAQSGAIISGSAALVILQPQQEPNDIDFYVPPKGLAQLLKFVLDHGYELTVPVPGEGGEGGYPRRIVLKLVHPISASRIDIVVPTTKNVVEEVTKFHSTVVMNYITSYGLVSLYPSWTMSGVDAIAKKGAVASGCIQKCRNRGYTIVNDPSVLPMGGDGQYLGPQAKRSTFDDETLFIPFDDVTPNLPTFDAREISWTLR
jgi:hypothetical protein